MSSSQNAKYLRLEIDLSALNAVALDMSVDTSCIPLSREFPDEQMQRAWKECSHDDDGLCGTIEMEKSHRDTAKQMLCLWYRYQIQSFIFEISLHNLDPEAHKIGLALLDSFQFPNEMMHSLLEWVVCTFSDLAPLFWLAHMLLRCTLVDKLEIIVAHLSLKGHLGNFSESAFRAAWPEGRKFTRCEKAGASHGDYDDKIGHGRIGWILPMGFEVEPMSKEVYTLFSQRYEPLENLAISLFPEVRRRYLPGYINLSQRAS